MSLSGQKFYEFGPFRLDPPERLLLRGGQPVTLSPKAYDLLVTLVTRAGHLVTKEELLKEVWPGTFVEEANLSYTVSLLRKALGDESEPYRYIETVPKRGYRFKARIEASNIGFEAAIPSVDTVRRHDRASAFMRQLPWALTSVLTVVLAVVLWRYFHPPAPGPQRTTRLAVSTQPLAILMHASSPAVALSPDGRHLAYVAGDSNRGQLYIRDLNSLEATPVRGAEDVSSPFYSPDSEWLGFYARGRSLQRVSLRGGQPVTICEMPTADSGGHGASWGDDDHIVFDNSLMLWRVSAAGGTPQRVGSPGAGFWPDVLPGGDAVIFTAGQPAADSDTAQAPGIYVQSFKTGELRLLVPNAGIARYARSGHLVYAHEASLLAAPFDLKTLTLTGPAVSVIGGLMMGLPDEPQVAEFAVSHSGTLAYLAGSVLENRRSLVWVSRSGKVEPLPIEPRVYESPRLSPDGSRLAFIIRDQNGRSDVWIHDLVRGNTSRLTSDGANDRPLWTPDSRRVVFRFGRGGPSHLFWRMADGTDQSERLTSAPNQDRTAMSFSPDGKKLAVVQANEKTGYDLHVFDIDGRRLQPLLQEPFVEGHPAISPDGRWLAYRSNETGRYEIYVRPFPDVDKQKWQVSTTGGRAPVWSPDAHELFYENDGKMMVVAVQQGGVNFASGPPKMLFESRYFRTGVGFREFDISPDGRRFIMMKEIASTIEASARDELTIVLNWFDELRQLARIDK